MEEAATPLPSEETTPPVTNIYFGAIRIARAATRFTAPDFSYLSGRPTITCRGVRGLLLQTSSTKDSVRTIMGERRCPVNSNSLRLYIQNFSARRNLFAHVVFKPPESHLWMRSAAL